MKRQTSIDVYRQIESEGLLSRLRWIVYSYVFHNGPCTMMEANQSLNKGKYSNGSYTSRFSELTRLGVIKECGTKKCQYTGRTAIIWDVTDRLPVKYEKAKKIKCERCNGTGYFIEQQSRFDV